MNSLCTGSHLMLHTHMYRNAFGSMYWSFVGKTNKCLIRSMMYVRLCMSSCVKVFFLLQWVWIFSHGAIKGYCSKPPFFLTIESQAFPREQKALGINPWLNLLLFYDEMINNGESASFAIRGTQTGQPATAQSNLELRQIHAFVIFKINYNFSQDQFLPPEMPFIIYYLIERTRNSELALKISTEE